MTLILVKTKDLNEAIQPNAPESGRGAADCATAGRFDCGSRRTLWTSNCLDVHERETLSRLPPEAWETVKMARELISAVRSKTVPLNAY